MKYTNYVVVFLIILIIFIYNGKYDDDLPETGCKLIKTIKQSICIVINKCNIQWYNRQIAYSNLNIIIYSISKICWKLGSYEYMYIEHPCWN